MKSGLVKRVRVRSKYFFDLIFSNGVRINVLRAAPFWIASLLVGLVAVVYTRLFAYTETLLQKILHWHSWMIFLMAPVCFLIAWLLVQLFARHAGGSGIPQVMAAIELATPKHDGKVKKFLSLRIIIVKIISSLMMVLGGGAIGREGPTIQIAGALFRIVNKIIPSSWPKLSRQHFILTGAAAGLAAAFNTPLGGVIFAIEELARTHIRFFRTALFSAVIIAGLTAQGLLGPYLYLGYPDVAGLKISIFWGVAATAILSGVLGSLMGKVILRLIAWKRSFSNLKAMLYVIGAGFLIALIAYFFNSQVLGSGKELMSRVLFTDNKAASWDTALLRIIGPIISFNTGAAGGIFAPSLGAGASLGAFISDMFHMQGADANILVLSGMVGFLTGVTRTPFTSAILVLEMTDRHNVIFHLMIAALISSLTAMLIDKHSLYEQLKKRYIEESVVEEGSVKET